MLFNSAAVIAALAVCTLATPRHSTHVLHETRDVDHVAWVKREAVPTGRKMPVRIGMTQGNLDIGHDLLMDVADVDSPNYGKYYSAEEVHEMFAPSPTAVTALRSWLADHDITYVSQSFNKQWLQFDLEVERLEELLQTKYYDYEHVDTGVVTQACSEYHVPSELQEHIDYITPGIKLMTTKKTKSSALKKRSHSPLLPPIIEGKVSGDVLAKAASGDLTNCDEVITPACIFAMYNITRGTTAVSANQLGIYEDLGQYYSQEDLNLYFEGLASYVPKGTHPQLRGIDGGGAKVPAPVAYAGIEADLDFEASIPIIYPQSAVLFQTDDQVYEEYFDYDGFLNNFFDGIDGSYCTYNAFGLNGNSPGIDPSYPHNVTGGYNHSLQCGAYKPTNVISISYGFAEQFLPVNYQRRQCQEVLKLGLQGVTVVVASGDSGVDDDGFCIDDYIFAPDFPASCPYITAVGATYLPVGHNVTKDTETAVTFFQSGGGFSNIHATPSFQTKAVNKYFLDHDPGYLYYRTVNNGSDLGAEGGIYNRAGRGYPDVAAVGWNFLAVVDGFSEIIGGTSLSSPVFAAILTRINEARLLAGKTTVGFVNPALYANPSMFHDITVGSNPGCETDGFFCVPGWDPVTGLGTPKFYQMMEYFLSLP